MTRLHSLLTGIFPVAAVLVLILAAIPISAGAQDTPATEGDQAMTTPRQYFVQLLGTRPGWPEHMTAEEEQVMRDHFVYLKRLIGEKKVLAAGPVFDPVFGLVILSVDTEAEAKEIMDNEPSVIAGVHTYEMHEMRMSLMADHISPDRYVTDPDDRILRKEIDVPASRSEVWEAWTTTPGVKTFFAADAAVDLRVGGEYEIYFNDAARPGERGSEGCRVLSFLPPEMLSFEWNAPPDFGPLRGVHTRVIIRFEEPEAGATRVRLAHTGWGKGGDWGKLYDYFDRAWSYVLDNLRTRFADGPIDWTSR